MKKENWIIAIVFTILAVISFTACSTERQVKKDCKGVKHYRQSNGVYL